MENVHLFGATFPTLPTLDQLGAILAGDVEHHHWPPRGMRRTPWWTHLLPDQGLTEIALLGRPDDTEGEWCWAWASEVDPELEGVEWVARLASYIPPLAGFRLLAEAYDLAGRVPLVWNREDPAMDWIRFAVHASLGSAEQMMHTFSVTPSGAQPVPLPADDAATRAVASLLGEAWIEAIDHQFTLSNGFNKAWLDYVGNHVTYDYATAAVVRQTTPNPKSGYLADAMETRVPTQRANILTGGVGRDAGVKLPLEVAMVVSLTTRSAGPSNRGRIYLGGQCISSLDANDGRFAPHIAELGAKAVGRFVERVRTDTPWQISIASRRTLVTHEVVKTAAGTVPDAQRRRRKNQSENKATAWTSPTI